MILKRKFDNELLKDNLEGEKEALNDVISSSLNFFNMDDEEYMRKKKIIEKLEKLSQLEKDILWLYSQKGASKASKLFGCSRAYIHLLVKQIKEKLND